MGSRERGGSALESARQRRTHPRNQSFVQQQQNTVNDDALLSRQVLMHRSNARQVSIGAVAAAVALAILLRGAVAPAALYTWVACVGAVVAGRWWIAVNRPAQAVERRCQWVWRRRFRMNFLAHGLVWGAAMALPLAPSDDVHRAVLVVALVSVASASYTQTAFDLASALFFGVPIAASILVGLLWLPDPTWSRLGLASLLSLAFMALSTKRSQAVVRKYETLRLAESMQAQALRSSEELLERTGQTAGVGGWELDVTTRALRLTSQAYRIHDAPPVDRPTFEGFVGLYAPPEQALIRTGLEETIRSGTVYDRELPLLTPRGRRVWVRLIGQPLHEAGRIVRISGVVQDVTQAKAAQQALSEQHHLLALLVRTAGEGFWFIDPQGLTTDVNPAMCDILGASRVDVLGRSIYEFVDEDNAQIFREQLQRRLQGAGGGYEITLRRLDGSPVHCHNNPTAIFDVAGQRIGSVGMWTDITDRKRAELALRSTGEQLAHKTESLQLTLDNINQGIISAQASGIVTVYNRRLLELLELPGALFEGPVRLQDLIAFQIARGDPDPMSGAEEGGALARVDQRGLPPVQLCRTRSGSTLEVRSLRLADGAFVRTFTDVTDYVQTQRRLSDSEAELRSLLDAFPGAIALLDAEMVYRYVNDKAAQVYGVPADQIVGRHASAILSPPRFEHVRDLLMGMSPGQTLTEEVEYPATSTRPRTWLQLTHAVTPSAGSGRNGIYALAIDVSARTVAEEALISARDEAQRANRAKSQFLSSMSHELRTPMNAILGFGQLLGLDSAHPLSAQQRSHLQEIMRGGRHLLSLINEVLDMALVESGKLTVYTEPVKLRPLVQECLALLQPLTSARDIHLDLEPHSADCAVLADRIRLKQVLLNLVSNAIKYNRRRGRVRVHIALRDAQVRIAIADEGPGLSPQQCARLFRAFERLDAGDSAVEGAGLGLALSRQLIDAMGGEIGVDSQPGQGSTFWVRLPGANAPARESAPEPEGGHPRTTAGYATPGRKVLYIEDNPVNVLLMEAMLARMPGVQMLSAGVPQVGLQMALDEHPDVILLDIQLPGMDGYEVLRRLRTHEAGRRVPVIAVSANAMANDIEQGLAAGFASYVTKPVDMKQLIAAVELAMPHA